ncbi:MAG: DUF2800 domain-containing protein [Gemmatimonadales bacterium]|nr:MAG: DUF2800 domain-containing protein [Gemmatimonadales bacterium]
MTDKPTIRASNGPIIEQCVGMVGATIRIDVESEIGEIGTEQHKLSARGKLTGNWDYDGGDSEMEFLLNQARRGWASIAGHFPEPQIEQFLEADLPKFRLTGHPDVYSVTEDRICVEDDKSGHDAEADVLGQLLLYAYLVGKKHGERPADLWVLWLREGTKQHWRFEWAQVVEYVANLHRRIARWNRTDFRAGWHCRYCPRQFACPAKWAMVRSTVRELAEFDAEAAERAGLALPVVSLYERVKLVEKQCKAFKSWLTARIAAHGPLVDGDRQIAMATRNMPVFDARKAWPIVTKALTEDEIEQCLDLKAGKIKELIKAKAPAGDKGKGERDFFLQLEEAGAYWTYPQPFLKVTKVKETNEDDASTTDR